MAAEALCHIRWHRHSRFPDLIPEDRLFCFRKLAGDVVATDGEVHRLLPNEQLAERSDCWHADRQSTSRAEENPLGLSRSGTPDCRECERARSGGWEKERTGENGLGP